jgi:intracellular multiplication protein IcmE
MDEFEQEGLEGFEEPQGKKGVVHNLTEAWRTKPIFKLMIIMAGVGLAVAAALGAFSTPPAPANSTLVSAPSLNEAPGGKASPYFIEQNKQANAQRANQALQQGGSALPTPVGNPVDIEDLTNPNKKDPLMEFRQETERLKEEMKQQKQVQAQQMQVLQQQVQQPQQQQEDDSLARAMQRQMQQLMDGWAPHSMKLVAGTATGTAGPTARADRTSERDGNNGEAAAATQANAIPLAAQKPVIAAGTVNYAQLLTEANSDVPSPILAQILSGPLAGGRAIGRFKVSNDYLVMEFATVTLKGKEYTVDALALDPNTTLSGMATEVDHRYFTRILLPAAGAFVSSFGTALGQGGANTTVTGDETVISQTAKSKTEAMYAGVGAAGTTAGQFFQNEANQTKTLVRVAVGTPLGLFFLTSVRDPDTQQNAQNQAQQLYPNQAQASAAALANAYGALQGSGVQQQGQQGMNGGYSVINGYGNTAQQTNPYGTNVSGAANTGYNPYATGYYGTTGALPYGSNNAVTLIPSSAGGTVYNRY